MNGFILQEVTQNSFQNAFTEIPQFESLIISEGTYSFETSEFSYE